MKRFTSILICLLLFLPSFALATDSATHTTDPQTSAYTAEPPANQMEQMDVTLFFRYQQTGYLACETQTIQISPDESPEIAVIRQLLAGPQASHTELERLFPHTTTIVGVEVTDDILLVTLNEGFLSDGIPDTWAEDPAWQTEAPLRRKLTIQSLVATITENFSYPYVQVFISHHQVSGASTRLSGSYFLDGSSGPAPLLYRDESLLLTMQTTASTILDAWYRRDYTYLYQFVADASPDGSKPLFEAFVEEIDRSPALVSFHASAGHSPENNHYGVVTLDLSLKIDEREVQHPAVPFRLIRENGIWKVPYSELKRLMLQ